MGETRKKWTDVQLAILYNQVNGICPMCQKVLWYEKNNQIKIYSDKYYLVLKKAIMNNSNEIFKIYDLIESLHKDVNSGNINGGSSSENISDYDKDYDGGDSFSNNNDYIENLDGGYV